VINSNSTLTWYLSKMRPYWIPLLRYDLRMGTPLRYHSPTHLLEQLRRKRNESTWSLLRTWSNSPPSNPNPSNDKEMSTEAHSFITIPLETLHEPQASILQCLKEPSCAKTVKDPCTQGQKSRNRHPKKIFQIKQVVYLRRRPILPEGYQILKKKWWKGFVGHQHDQGRRYKFCFPFYFPHI
jgi:hypothetical protein